MSVSSGIPAKDAFKEYKGVRSARTKEMKLQDISGSVILLQFILDTFCVQEESLRAILQCCYNIVVEYVSA